jgi:4-oxalomesaconate tautomerase
MQTSIRCLFMRGGTSRGPFFLESDLPADTAIRDCVLLAAMGSLRYGNPKCPPG